MGAKGKGEKERYMHLNAEFQRIARRDKKTFLRNQCKKIEETVEWESLEFSSRKLEISREHFMQRNWKRSTIFIPIPKKGNAKEGSNHHTNALISHASKVMLKILQATLQQYMNCELPDVQARFRKTRGTRDQKATSIGSSKKQEGSRKTSTSALLSMPKP